MDIGAGGRMPRLSLMPQLWWWSLCEKKDFLLTEPPKQIYPDHKAFPARETKQDLHQASLPYTMKW